MYAIAKTYATLSLSHNIYNVLAVKKSSNVENDRWICNRESDDKK